MSALTKDTLASALSAVHAACVSRGEGQVASYIPELARVPPDLFGLAACTVSGEMVAVGDVAHPFTLQSLSKPFLYGLVLDAHGVDAVRARVGVEPTGDAFDALIQLERVSHHHHDVGVWGRRSEATEPPSVSAAEFTSAAANPMINAGALAVASLVPGADPTERFQRVLRMLREACGRDDVPADMAVYLSEREASHRNRAIAHLMRQFGMLDDVEGTLDLYIQQCAVLVDTRDLAVMAATLAAGGVNPRTGRRVLSAETVSRVLAVMFTCGLYDEAGRFAFSVGLPAKSGVCGGILAVAPGRFGVAAFSPRLDAHGNSVRGLGALTLLSERLRLHALDPSTAPSPSALDHTRLTASVRAAAEAGPTTQGGVVASYIPELARADPSAFAIALCTVDGWEAAEGAAGQSFTLQSAANPFTYALALQAHGVERVHERVGVEPSGNPFHAIVLDPRTNRPMNPLSNAGAIAVASLVPGADAGARLAAVLGNAAAFAGEDAMTVDAATLQSERATAHRNRAIAHLLRHFGVVEDEEQALALYLQQCSIAVTCRQLARMGAALAAGGVQPRTGRRVLDAALVPRVLSLMAVTGMNEASGRFAFEVGLPAKSGISGCVVAVAPGRFGAAVWSPRVDAQGNSVTGVAALQALARALEVRLLG